jgi:hypothetical protein
MRVSFPDTSLCRLDVHTVRLRRHASSQEKIRVLQGRGIFADTSLQLFAVRKVQRQSCASSQEKISRRQAALRLVSEKDTHITEERYFSLIFRCGALPHTECSGGAVPCLARALR